jgi:glycosyltransferase involved in cell wall biosynthesis
MDTGLPALSALASVKPYDKAFINQMAISLPCREELNIEFDMSKPKLRIAMLGPSLEQQGGIATVEKHILKHISPEIKIQHITSHDEGTINHRVVVFVKALGALLWILLRGKTDIVHLHISERGSVVRKVIFTIITFMFGKPVLVHTHGAEFDSFFSELPKWAQQGISFIFRSCTRFIVLSKTCNERYVLNLKLKPKQVFVLPNCVEVPVQVPNRTNTAKVSFVFCGRIGHRKGAFDLIRAFADLPLEQKNRSVLVLAGDGDVEQARKLVESLNLTAHVTFLGWVNQEQRDKALAKADVFVLPSYNEGLPMAILEAMAWGLPVLTTPVGGIPEVVTTKKNGLLVNPGNIEQLSKAMQLLIENEALRLSLGSTARKTVAPFEVKKYCYYLDEIYRSLLQNNLSQGTESARSEWYSGNSTN